LSLAQLATGEKKGATGGFEKRSRNLRVGDLVTIGQEGAVVVEAEEKNISGTKEEAEGLDENSTNRCVHMWALSVMGMTENVVMGVQFHRPGRGGTVVVTTTVTKSSITKKVVPAVNDPLGILRLCFDCSFQLPKLARWLASREARLKF
jgi:hypothetical protein